MPFYQDISAATLGYITGNLKGAKKAYAASRAFSSFKNNNATSKPTTMAVKRKRGRRTAQGRFPKRRKTTNRPVHKRQTRIIQMGRKKSFSDFRSIKPDISHTTTDGTRSVKFTVILKNKMPKHDSGNWNYSQTHSFLSTGPSGTQAVSDAFSVGNIDQFIASTGAGYSTFQNFTAIQQLNPYLTNTGSVYLTPQTTPLTDRFLVKNITMKTTFASYADIDQTGWIYYLTPRVHCTSTPLTAWTNTGGQLSAGRAAMTFPPAGSTVGTSGSTLPTYPYETPIRSSTFHKLWKILKVVKVQLASGSHQIINATFRINKIFKNDHTATDLAEGSRYMPGLTIFVMPVWLGQVVLDRTVAGTPIPTWGITRVGCITVNEYTCSSVSGNAGRLSLAIETSNIPTNAAVANLQQINEDTGALDVETLNA